MRRRAAPEPSWRARAGWCHRLLSGRPKRPDGRPRRTQARPRPLGRPCARPVQRRRAGRCDCARRLGAPASAGGARSLAWPFAGVTRWRALPEPKVPTFPRRRGIGWRVACRCHAATFGDGLPRPGLRRGPARSRLRSRTAPSPPCPALRPYSAGLRPWPPAPDDPCCDARTRRGGRDVGAGGSRGGARGDHGRGGRQPQRQAAAGRGGPRPRARGGGRARTGHRALARGAGGL